MTSFIFASLEKIGNSVKLNQLPLCLYLYENYFLTDTIPQKNTFCKKSNRNNIIQNVTTPKKSEKAIASICMMSSLDDVTAKKICHHSK